MKGVLATPEDLNKQKYLAAACAINANMLETAFPYLEDLRKVNERTSSVSSSSSSIII